MLPHTRFYHHDSWKKQCIDYAYEKNHKNQFYPVVKQVYHAKTYPGYS